MSRFWLVVLGVSLAALPLKAQAPPERSENLYSLALQAAAEAEAKAYGHLKDRDWYNLVVEKAATTEDIPGQFGAFRVLVLDYPGLRDRFYKQGEFPVLEVSPARIKGPHLIVNITTSWFSYREPRLFRHPKFNFAVEGGADVEFRYDGAKQQFVVDHVSLWGI